jgi:predicted dehydrogenase
MRIVLVGLAGYGETYVRVLLDRAHRDLRVVGGVDPAAERCSRLGDLKDLGVPIAPDLADFFHGREEADLAIVATPIHLHHHQVIACLEQGCHVLCEKPAAGTPAQVRAMIEAADHAGREVFVGFQWSFTRPIQALKRDILAGRLGRPKRFRTLVLWPRTQAYFRRSPWAGTQRVGSAAVYDSPVQNAAAHYLHNCFYLLGEAPERSAAPQTLVAEAYRANDIENFDTGCLRVQTRSGCEVLFYASHAVPHRLGPLLTYEFEEATVCYGGPAAGGFVAVFRDGRRHAYGSPEPGSNVAKIDAVLRCLRGESTNLCDLRAATPHALAIEGLRRSVGEPVAVPGEAVATTEARDDRLTWVRGLEEVLVQCYASGILPVKHGGLPWTVAGAEVTIQGDTERWVRR